MIMELMTDMKEQTACKKISGRKKFPDAIGKKNLFVLKMWVKVTTVFEFEGDRLKECRL